MLHIAARVACLAFLELGDCLGGSYGRLFRVRRISGSGKLASANQTDRDQPRDKLWPFHAAILIFANLLSIPANCSVTFDGSMTLAWKENVQRFLDSARNDAKTITRRSTWRTHTGAGEGAVRRILFVSCRSTWR